MTRDTQKDSSGLARAGAKLGSLIPGYTGYKKRERIREEDRAVRQAVARQLGLIFGKLERALSGSIRQLPPKDVETADKILRGLTRQRDRVRFAPEGYASLFSSQKVQTGKLEGLLALDTELWAVLEKLDHVAGEWDGAVRRGEVDWPKDALKDIWIELEDALDERESYLRS